MFPAVPEVVPFPSDPPPHSRDKRAGPFATSPSDHPGSIHIRSEEGFKISCLELYQVALLRGKVRERKWSAGKKAPADDGGGDTRKAHSACSHPSSHAQQVGFTTGCLAKPFVGWAGCAGGRECSRHCRRCSPLRFQCPGRVLSCALPPRAVWGLFPLPKGILRLKTSL